jgi:ribosomal protein S18 acetylase RimI-like enzyme
MVDCRVVNVDSSHQYKDQFIALYQDSFKEPPYCENWSYEDVEVTWCDHVSQGMVVVCVDATDRVIGFVCGYMGHLRVTDAVEQVESQLSNFNLEKTLYVSELAVAREHRRKGFANAMVDCMFGEFKKQGATHYFLRSDLNNSVSAPLFIKYYNGKKMDIVASKSDACNFSASKEKGFWCGPL